MRSLTALLLAAFAATAARAEGPTPSPVEARRDRIARELIGLGGELQRAIEAEDVAALVARVPAVGLRCGPRVVPRERVERELRSETSWLHGVLFGGPGHVPSPGVAPSLRALFREASEVAVLVAFRRDPAAGAVGLPCVDYRAPGLGTPGAPLCFERRDGRWWFTESLYPCR